MKQIHIISRLANWSLLMVLLALTGFSMWAAKLNEQATSVAASSTYVSGLYRQMTLKLSWEEAVQYEYVLRPSTLLRNEHPAAANPLIALFQRLQHDGEP